MTFFSGRKALAFFCTACLLSLSLVYGQNAPESGEGQAAAALSSDQSTLSLSTDQSTIMLPAPVQPTGQGAPSAVWLFIRMVLVLALVVALMYAVLRFMRKGTAATDTDDPFLRRVAGLSLGQGKSVQVVTLLDHAYLVGISDSAINLIGEVHDKELVDSMNLYADKNTATKKPRSFSDVLELFMPMAGRGGESGAGEAAGPAAGGFDSAAGAASESESLVSPVTYNPDESIEAAERRAWEADRGASSFSGSFSAGGAGPDESASPAASISRLRDRLKKGFETGGRNEN